MRYHSLKDGAYTLCPACYAAGRFPSSMYAGGFVRMDDEAFKHASGAGAAAWSDQETLLLLEGVEMHDEDWARVAEHVGTRSKEQCILHFLQLPIEDEYLAGEGAALGPLQYAASVGRGAGANANAGSDGQPAQGPGALALPFSQTDNPVMSVVAFLAGAVSPGVAAAAAQRALGELTEDLKRKAEQAKAGKADKAAEAGQNAEMKSGEEVEGTSKEVRQPAEDGSAMQVDAPDGPDAPDATGPPEPPAEASTAPASAPITTNGHTATSSNPAPAVPAADVSRIASLALGSAAAKASVLATHEERRIESLVTRLVSAQMRKLELKMTLFERFEEMLEAEKRQIEVQKQQFYKERLTLQGQLQIVQGAIKRAQEQPGGATGAELKSTVDGVERALNTASAAGVRETGVEAAEAPTDGQVQTLA